MTPLIPPAIPSQHTRRTRGRLSSLLAACLLLLGTTLAACDSAEHAIAPGSAVSARAANGANQSTTEAFIAAQGTYCVRDIPGDCDVIDSYGLGYILAWCSLSCDVNPALTMDFAGVNTKWWDRNNLPSIAPYSYTGGVSESRLSDGRRRLIVNIHARNTFMLLYSLADGFTPLVGAAFTEYPIFITDEPRTPIVGDVSISAELIVPATYIGMPDITHFFFFPAQGMEVRRLNLTGTTTGPLRVAYDGIAAGTVVDVTGTSVFLPKLGANSVGSRRLIARNFEVMSKVTVRRTKAP